MNEKKDPGMCFLEVEGGVCAAKGFLAAGVHAGIRKNKTKRDLALIYSEQRAAAAAVYTQNLVVAAPITVTKEHLQNGSAKAVLCNSGNANACNKDGLEIAREMCKLAADALSIETEDVIVASTGVIGEPLDIKPIRDGMPELVRSLGDNSDHAAEAIMTTDLRKKELAVEFLIGGKRCVLGGIAKGSGMIHPNMATMLIFLTSDVAITPEMLSLALSRDVKDTFNMISVDGDTSTNDMVSILANGLAENPLIDRDGEDFRTFCAALRQVTLYLSRAIARDGEGATKLLVCKVTGARCDEDAKVIARTVIASSLVKTAMTGADPNWGRVLCAIGYSGVQIDPRLIDISFYSEQGRVDVCVGGFGVQFSEDRAKKILSAEEIEILIKMREGEASATAYGCDLTNDYVEINSDYRT